MKPPATISPLEIIAETEKALANVKDSALALVSIAETPEGDRRFLLQQIAWSIQNELGTAEACLKDQKERASQASARSDQTTVVPLNRAPATPDG